MWKIFLANKSGTPLNVQTGVDGSQCLVTDGVRTLDAHWRSANITTATTTTIVEASPNESIMLTDLIIILSKKVAAATIIPRFACEGHTINLFTFDGNVDAFQFSHAFTGGLRGWKEADFQIVTNEATTVGVLVGYVHVASKQTKTYSEWDSER